MSDKKFAAETGSTASTVPRWARYVFWGAIVGLASALSSLFVVTFYYGETIGLVTKSCAILGCAMTAMLSQPAGLLGLLVGAACGALCGVVVHFRSGKP